MANTAWRNEKRRLREEAAEAEERASNAAYWGRYNDLWNVPERGKHAYLAMEDNFCPSTVLDFMLAMHPEPEGK